MASRLMLIRRLRFAWWFKTWPWAIPWQTVKYVALDQRLTLKEIAHAHDLAVRHGWERSATLEAWIRDNHVKAQGRLGHSAADAYDACPYLVCAAARRRTAGRAEA